MMQRLALKTGLMQACNWLAWGRQDQRRHHTHHGGDIGRARASQPVLDSAHMPETDTRVCTMQVCGWLEWRRQGRHCHCSACCGVWSGAAAGPVPAELQEGFQGLGKANPRSAIPPAVTGQRP